MTPDDQDTQTGAHRDHDPDIARSIHDEELAVRREELRRRYRQAHILREVASERDRQDAKWGVQRHPNGTNPARYGQHRELSRTLCDAAARQGVVTWRHILLEEVYEGLAEEHPAKLRSELVQVAAVVVNWIEDLDSRA